MDKIFDFLMDNISNLTSSRSISLSLTSNNENVNHKTVSNYVEYLCNAFTFYKFKRYDIKGKKYLATNDKYYLSDHTFRYAKLGTKNMDYGRVIENIVAMKSCEKIYIQVSDNISDEQTFKREVSSLLKINDAYPKMIIVRTRHEEYQYEGIKIIDIADWLMLD